MNKAKHLVSSEEMVEVVIDGIQNKKGQDIVVMDLREIDSAVTDYFVICTASSFTQLDAIADEVEDKVLEKSNERPNMNPNRSNQKWLVLDYFNVIVHVFLDETRKRYGLEELWGDAKITTLQNI